MLCPARQHRGSEAGSRRRLGARLPDLRDKHTRLIASAQPEPGTASPIARRSKTSRRPRQVASEGTDRAPLAAAAKETRDGLVIKHARAGRVGTDLDRAALTSPGSRSRAAAVTSQPAPPLSPHSQRRVLRAGERSRSGAGRPPALPSAPRSSPRASEGLPAPSPRPTSPVPLPLPAPIASPHIPSLPWQLFPPFIPVYPSARSARLRSARTILARFSAVPELPAGPPGIFFFSPFPWKCQRAPSNASHGPGASGRAVPSAPGLSRCPRRVPGTSCRCHSGSSARPCRHHRQEPAWRVRGAGTARCWGHQDSPDVTEMRSPG